MGKASVDLPDPLQQSTAASPAASADDLLSQLAGDEIDRLLAEADTERPPVAPAASAPSTASVAPTEPMPATAPVEAPATPSVATDPPAAVAEGSSSEPSSDQDTVPAASPIEVGVTAPPEQPSGDAGQAVSQQLDVLFEQLNASPAEQAAAASTEASATPPPADATAGTSVAVEGNDMVSAKDLDQVLAQAAPSLLPSAEDAEVSLSSSPSGAVDVGTSDAERDMLDALESTSTDDSTDEGSDSAASEDFSEIDSLDTPLPVYLKPLVWINAPFASLPQPLRESLGKAAVLTLVNAVAVLLYVLIFR